MSILTRADVKYRAATQLDLDRMPVHDAIVSKVCADVQILLTAIDARERPDVWHPTRSAASALRWALLTRPRIGLDGRTVAQAALNELRRQAEVLAGQVDAPVWGKLCELASDGNALASGTDGLSQQIIDSLEDRPAGRTCVVLADATAKNEAESALPPFSQSALFLTPRQFLSGEVWDAAVVVGISKWFPDEIFTAPRCFELTLVHHHWLEDRDRVSGMFSVSESHSLSILLPRQDRSRLDRVVVQPPTAAIDWTAIAPVSGTPHGNDPAEMVSARLIILAGGYGFYLERNAETVRGLDPAGHPGRWIRQLPAADLGPDRVIALRKGVSELDALRPYVSEILGDRETSVREHQAQWKSRLARRLDLSGLHDIALAVDRPQLTLEYARYWAGPTCISPRRPAFEKLLKHLDVPDPSATIDAAAQLHSAHVSAGHQLAKELERSVDETVLQRLSTEHSVTLSTGNALRAGQTTLFRIVAISPETTNVPARILRIALELKGTRWLE
ncbi:hypothetical protein [Nocardia sp. NPDC050412]|uniref:hypothetical protein n=1 Tax=Nocardia sp. NPDC050412 TaxID=3364320 RepID=UPI00379FFED2